jgi:hypothetical protein
MSVLPMIRPERVNERFVLNATVEVRLGPFAGYWPTCRDKSRFAATVGHGAFDGRPRMRRQLSDIP